VIRTLIVDDDFRVAALHRAFTERIQGYAVIGEAHTGAEALSKCAALRPQLVLLDIYLPDISGLEIARRLREPGRAPVDVIAITAARDVDTVRAAIQSGVLNYLVKPFSFGAFREKLEAYAALVARLSQVREADQHEVDRIYGLLRSQPPSRLPKGLSQATLDLVRQVLAEAGSDLTAAEVASRAGVSRVTARRYLEHLCDTGHAALRLRYGTAGRPEHRYRTASI
jgi:two-component system CitB family response regulator